jgi:hypothetical protein
MPLISLEATPDLGLDLKDRAEYWVYRVGDYLLINVIDDPAWLALLFC